MLMMSSVTSIHDRECAAISACSHLQLPDMAVASFCLHDVYMQTCREGEGLLSSAFVPNCVNQAPRNGSAVRAFIRGEN